MTKNKRIGLIQMSCAPDTAANLDKHNLRSGNWLGQSGKYDDWTESE